MEVNQKVSKAFDTIIKVSKEFIKEKNGFIPTIIFVSDSKGLGLIRLPDMPYGEEKHKLFETIGKKLADEIKDAIGFIFVSEAWMSVQNKITDEDLRKGNFMRASEDPNKIEVMTINGKDINGNSKMYMACIKRDKDNKIIDLEENEESQEFNKMDWINSSKKDGISFKSELLDRLFVAYKFNTQFKNLIK